MKRKRISIDQKSPSRPTHQRRIRGGIVGDTLSSHFRNLLFLKCLKGAPSKSGSIDRDLEATEK